MLDLFALGLCTGGLRVPRLPSRRPQEVLRV